MLRTLAVDGYRSIRSLAVELAPLTVITGENGTGKSSLYRALRLLAATGRDGAVAGLAAEGGLASTLWAGPESAGGSAGARSSPVGLRLGFATEEVGYSIEFGLPQTIGPSAFARDPEIKVEAAWTGETLRPGTLQVERHGIALRVRDDDGWHVHDLRMPPWTSMISEFSGLDESVELFAVRRALASWRFYDHLRTDSDAPARRSPVGTRTPVLSADGGDLAAALQTVLESGRDRELPAAVASAFPGSRVEVRVDESSGRFTLLLRQPGMLRPLEAAELSDGTLRYLLWIAALLSPRPAGLLVLNEPETSLHPSLLEPLAGLVAAASADSQIIVVSHSGVLVAALEQAGALVHAFEKVDGETRIAGRGRLEGPPWSWPKR